MTENVEETCRKGTKRKSAIYATNTIKQCLNEEETEEAPQKSHIKKHKARHRGNSNSPDEDYTLGNPDLINISELLSIKQEQGDHEIVLTTNKPLLKTDRILGTRTLKYPTKGPQTISGSVQAEGSKFQVICDLCGDKFHTKFKFNRHIKSAHNLDKLQCVLQCKYCPQKSKTTQDLKFHMLMFHLEALNLKTCWYECSKCHFKSTESEDLDRHKRELYGCEGAVVLIYHCCIECPYRSDRVSTVQGHIKCHYKAGGSKCPHCTFRCPRTKVKVMDEHLALHKNK